MLKKMLNKVKNVAMSAKAVLSGVMMSVVAMPVFASSPSINTNLDIASTLSKLVGKVLELVIYAGAIIAIFGGIQFFLAFKEGDASGQHRAVMTFITGLGIIGIRLFLQGIGVFTG